MMSGISFVTDPKGNKTAVLIDLRRHAQVWEDFHDGMIAEKRKKEPRESLESVRKQLATKRRASHV